MRKGILLGLNYTVVLIILIIATVVCLPQAAESASLIGKLNIPNLASRIAIHGDYAYITSDYNMPEHEIKYDAFYIVDISDPRDLRILGRYYIDLPGGIYDVLVDRNTAYVAGTGDSGLHVFDVSDPTNPRLIYRNTDIKGHAMAFVGDYIYMSKYRGLHIINKDPDDIHRIITIQLFEEDAQGYVGIANMAVEGNYLYTATGDAGLMIYDISDPLNPTLLSDLAVFPCYAMGVAVEGRYAYIVTGGFAWSLQIIDISDPHDPSLVHYEELHAPAVDIIVQNGRAYVANYSSGLKIFDVTNPERPIMVDNYWTPGYTDDLVVRDGIAYVMDCFDILVIDVSTPFLSRKMSRQFRGRLRTIPSIGEALRPAIRRRISPPLERLDPPPMDFRRDRSRI